MLYTPYFTCFPDYFDIRSLAQCIKYGINAHDTRDMQLAGNARCVAQNRAFFNEQSTDVWIKAGDVWRNILCRENRAFVKASVRRFFIEKRNFSNRFALRGGNSGDDFIHIDRLLHLHYE